MLNEYFRTKDLRREAIKERNYLLADEYLKKLEMLLKNLSPEEREYTYYY